MKMQEKVVLPKEVAEAIEYLRKRDVTNHRILKIAEEAVFTKTDLVIRRWAFDEDGAGNPDLLMKALVNGYLVEATPEDKLRKYYEVNRTSALWDSDDEFYQKIGRREGVHKTLVTLGITVEGIND